MGVNLCNPSSTQVYKVVELNHRKCSVCVCVCVCKVALQSLLSHRWKLCIKYYEHHFLLSMV